MLFWQGFSSFICSALSSGFLVGFLTQVWSSAIVWIQDGWRQKIGLKDKSRCGEGVQVVEITTAKEMKVLF